MDKKLFVTRKDIFSKCPNIYWEVSILAIVLAIALVALEAVLPGLYVLTFSFIFFPALFAVFMTLFTIKFGGTVTIKSTFSIAKSYYSRTNFGCFSLIKNFFHALLVEIIASFALALVLHSAFSMLYGNLFTDAFNSLFDVAQSGSLESMESLLADTPLGLYLDTISSFSMSIAIIAFVFGISFNSMRVYLCANIPNSTASISGAIFNKFLRTHRKSYRRDFWSLNWPVFVLLPIGMVIGYLFIFVLDIDFTYALPVSTLVGLLCLVPFAPFFFAGTEALFAKYCEDIKKASFDLTAGFLKNLLNNPDVSNEDKGKINEFLSKSDNENHDDKDSQG